MQFELGVFFCGLAVFVFLTGQAEAALVFGGSKSLSETAEFVSFPPHHHLREPAPLAPLAGDGAGGCLALVRIVAGDGRAVPLESQCPGPRRRNVCEI